MRRAVCAAPGLPGVRLLQGPPGADRHGGRLILRLVAAEDFRVISFIYANRSGCHGRRPRLRGRHRRRQAGAGGQQKNLRAFTSSATRPTSTAALAATRLSRPSRAHRPRQRSRGDGRQARHRAPQEKGFLHRAAPPNSSATARPMRWFRSATPAAFSRRPPSRSGRISGVDRGCIATVIPRQENEFVLLDAGANIECKPLHLAQFAVMGSVYSREVLGRKKPARGHSEHRHGRFQGQRTDARSVQTLPAARLEFHRQRRRPRFVQGPRGRGRVRRLCGQHRFENIRKPGRGDVFDAQTRIDAQSQTANRRVSREKRLSRHPPAHGSGGLWRRAAARFQRHGVQGARLGARTRHCQRAARDGGGRSASRQPNHRPRNCAANEKLAAAEISVPVSA